MGFDALETVVVVAVVVAVFPVVLVVVLLLLAVLAVLVLVLVWKVACAFLAWVEEAGERSWNGCCVFWRCWKASSCLSHKTKRKSFKTIQADPATSHCALAFDGLHCLRGLSRLRDPLRLV